MGLASLPACNNQYGTIGISTVNRASITGGDMTLLAGKPGGAGNAEGIGDRARFSAPSGITENDGILYIADRDNHAIRKIDLSTRQVTTLAGTAGRSGSGNGRGKDARFTTPEGIATDGAFLYVADTGNHAIRKIDLATGDVTTLAGRRGQPGKQDSTNGAGNSATFRGPGGLIVAGSFLYVADSDNHAIRQVNLATGETLTIAGTMGTPGFKDSIGQDALFNTPIGIVALQDAGGAALYVTELRNHVIRRIDLVSQEVTTVAGKGTSGYADGVALDSYFASPSGLAVHKGRLYITERGSSLIREYDPVRLSVRAVAGYPGVPGSADGPPVVNRFNNPIGIVGFGDQLYITDSGNDTIRSLDIQTFVVGTFAGLARSSGSIDGPTGVGRLSGPTNITMDDSALYVADTGRHTIRRVDLQSGEITTVAGSAGEAGTSDSSISPAFFNSPKGVLVNSQEDQIFIVDTGNHAIRRLFMDTGKVETFTGKPGIDNLRDGGVSVARFRSPQGMTQIGDYFYIADTGNHAIRRIQISTQEVTLLAGYPGTASTADPTIILPLAGQADGTGANALFNDPQDITTDGTLLYIADTLNHTIRSVDPGTGEVLTLFGAAGQKGFVDSPNGDARFNAPGGILYHNGFLYVSDTGNFVIRKIDLSNGSVSLLAGDKSCVDETKTVDGQPVVTQNCSGQPTGVSNFGTNSEDATQPGTSVSFGSPAGLAADGQYLYVMDTGSHTLRRVDLTTGETWTIGGGQGFSDGLGGRMSSPTGVSLIGSHLYFTDTGNHLLRVADVSDAIGPAVNFSSPGRARFTTLAGNVKLSGLDNVTERGARFNRPAGITTDGQGNLYVSDTANNTIRKIELATGNVTTIAGIPQSSGYVNTESGTGLFNGPQALVWDRDHLYIVDTGNHAIRRLTLSTGRLSLVAGHGDERTQTGSEGTEDSTGQASGFKAPQGITVDETYLYVTDTGNHTIRRLLKATGEVRTIAGMPRETGSTDEIGFDARFNAPVGITLDGDFLYVTDYGNNLIRRVDKITRDVVTLTGALKQQAFSPGLRSEVRLGGTFGIITSPSVPYLYVVDSSENVIGRITK